MVDVSHATITDPIRINLPEYGIQYTGNWSRRLSHVSGHVSIVWAKAINGPTGFGTMAVGLLNYRVTKMSSTKN